ncbi:hypothetical protein E4T42_05135 [Aureobasidium subglaciale]|nr:hypothetical protein E4T42_05135 [Aureobasidium subglaciale]
MMHGLLFSVLFSTLASALPQVAFPFNSQVPAVARANEAYDFQLATTTFVSSDGSTLVYSLSGAPAWLNLESVTRTLYGKPGQGNTGPNVFKIVATDNGGSAEMDCTLVVASNNVPVLKGNISTDLARSGPLSGPSTLILQPSTAFAITFSNDTFGNSGAINSYYATMADRTPLPSWLKFDSGTLTFWGMTPLLVTGSQTYGVDFIASDVAGFAGAATTFSLLISSNQLAFSPQTENITVTPGKIMILGPFVDQLLINGVKITGSQTQHAVAKAPDWLTFNNITFELTGTPPQDFEPQSIAITVTDTYGDTAVKNVFLRTANTSLFDDEVGNLTATAGKLFHHTFPSSLVTRNDIGFTVDVGSASSWLKYDENKQELQGTPPTATKASANKVTAIASSLSATESQIFYVNVNAATVVVTSRTTSSTTPSPTSAPSSSATSSPAKSERRSMTAGIIVGIVIGCLAVLALFFAIAMLCCRRKRKQPRKKIEKGDIRPILPYGDQEPMVVDTNQDEENYIGSPVKHSPDEPPQLDVDLPTALQPPMKPRYFLGGRDARQSKFPTLPPATTADNWATTDSSSDISRSNSDAKAAAQYASYAVEMELPRHERTWVRPGEASPTPPPSSVLRAPSNTREAARRKWAERLNRNSSGNLASRSPSPLRITLSGVSASGIKGRKQRLKEKFDDDKENKGEDRLSKLVSNDSFSDARQMRGRKSLVQVEVGSRIRSSRADLEEVVGKDKVNTAGDGEWEDETTEDAAQSSSKPAGVLVNSVSNASVRFL